MKTDGFEHVEEIQLFVDQIAKDRVSDLTCSLTKSFLIDFTDRSMRQALHPNEGDHSYRRLRLHGQGLQKRKGPAARQSKHQRASSLILKRWVANLISYEITASAYVKDGTTDRTRGRLLQLTALADRGADHVAEGTHAGRLQRSVVPADRDYFWQNGSLKEIKKLLSGNRQRRQTIMKILSTSIMSPSIRSWILRASKAEPTQGRKSVTSFFITIGASIF